MIQLTEVNSNNRETPIWINPALISRMDKMSKNTGDSYEDSWEANTRIVILEKGAYFVKETVENILNEIKKSMSTIL